MNQGILRWFLEPCQVPPVFLMTFSMTCSPSHLDELRWGCFAPRNSAPSLLPGDPGQSGYPPSFESDAGAGGSSKTDPIKQVVWGMVRNFHIQMRAGFQLPDLYDFLKVGSIWMNMLVATAPCLLTTTAHWWSILKTTWAVAGFPIPRRIKYSMFRWREGLYGLYQNNQTPVVEGLHSLHPPGRNL